ncbi:MAG: hypothetical protein LC808_20410 [Actinobacteria bacterium]|nr:hypothetical protein [Actinomycetota bacterium]
MAFMGGETYDSELKRRFRLPINEVSALCVRRETELLAVGDEEFVIVNAAIGGDGLNNEFNSRQIGDIRDEEVRGGKFGSEWEAIAADGKGRVFIVKESSLTVVVLSRGLGRHVHSIELDVKDGPDEQALELLDDANAGPEGIVLLQGGRLLVAKQKEPALLIEFGSPDAGESSRFEPRAHLSSRFELSKGRRTRLVPLHSWRLYDESKKDLKSANDLAVDHGGRLHAISSLSRSIYELPRRSVNREMVAKRRWRLPDGMELCRERKAEGLTFDSQGHPIVAIDSKDEKENLFVLTRLCRGGAQRG